MKNIRYIFLLCLFGLQITIAQVTEAEYFWNTDPGEGNGTAIAAVDGMLDQVIETLFANGVTTPVVGTHTFHVRIKDAQNNWGPVFTSVVVNEAISMTTPVTITQAEYFWDTDSGEGNGQVIVAFDGNLDQAIETVFASGITVPSIGTHTFNIRVRDTDTTWGPIFTSVVTNEEILTTLPNTIVQAEYYWNTDPGEGNGETILAVDGNLNQALEKLFKDEVPLVKEGLNTFNIRVKDTEDTWGPVFTSVVSVEATLGIEEDTLLANTSVLSPNPASDMVTLDINNNYIGEVDIIIRDMIGKVVYQTTFNKNNILFSKNFDVRSFSKGAYLVQLHIGNRVAVKRLMR